MTNKEDLVKRLTGILQMQAHLFHGIARRLRTAHPVEADAIIDGALTAYGSWRGERLRVQHDSRGLVASLSNIVLHWDNGDFHVVRAINDDASQISPGSAWVNLGHDPFAMFLKSAGATDLAGRYYRTVLNAFATSFGSGINVAVKSSDDGAWIVHWSMSRNVEVPVSLSDTASDTASLVKNGANLFGALYYFLGTQMIESLNDSGEQLLRKAVRETARERGEALRKEHIEAGLTINLESLMKNYDSPVEEAFEWADGEIMTPTSWHADCTYCPFYDVWRGMEDGQKLGWLFDEELHPALYQAYHPGIQVKFVSNKNRGDQVCGFRFDIVEGEACAEAIFEPGG